jgi:hypothetical protein
MSFFRALALTVSLGLFAACAPTTQVTEPKKDLGDFALGFAVVNTANDQKVPISREATDEEWKAALVRALEARFRRYEGTKLYNIGIAVDGYALAPPGVPLVVKPKSILVASAVLFDDATATQLNMEGRQFTAFERRSTDTFIGSGLTRTKEEQIEELAFVFAKRVEEWLYENRDWFGVKVDRPRTAPAPTVVSKP